MRFVCRIKLLNQKIRSGDQFITKDIKLLSKYLSDVALKTSGCVVKVKKYYLILRIAIFNMKTCLSLITFLDSYSMIDTSWV